MSAQFSRQQQQPLFSVRLCQHLSNLPDITACRLALFFAGLSNNFLKSSMCVSSSTRSRSMFTNDESERAERSWYKPRRPTRDSLSSIIGKALCSRRERRRRKRKETQVVLYEATESSLSPTLLIAGEKKASKSPHRLQDRHQESTINNARYYFT